MVIVEEDFEVPFLIDFYCGASCSLISVHPAGSALFEVGYGVAVC